MPSYHPNQHPYNYAQYTQPTYTPEFQAGQVSPNYQVPFPSHNGQLATPHPRPKHFSRNTHTTNEHVPYKGVLKNTHVATPAHPEIGLPTNGQFTRRSTKQKRERDGLRGRSSEPAIQSVPRRTSSLSSRRPDRSISRQRTNSKTRFIPGKANPWVRITTVTAHMLAYWPADHVFVSFKNDNELHVTGIVEQDSDRLSEAVLQMWPDGHDVMVRRLRC